MEDKWTSEGNIIANSNGVLTHKRYINPKIEQELVEFKIEVEDKFNKSPLKDFKFPLMKTVDESPRRGAANDYGMDPNASIITDTKRSKMVISKSGRRYIDNHSVNTYTHDGELSE